LNDAVTNLSRLLQRTLDETIDLSCESPADLPMVLADKGMIEQVLMNLAVNARDAMPKGGELRIRLQMVEITQIYVNTHPNSHPGRFVCMSVSDTGCGMDSDTLKRIFEPFFTTKGPGKGTGLGLATVYGIIKQHSGWIEVESRVNKGTTFKIFLPATDQRPDRPHTPEITILQELVGGNETILLVEDEEILREVAQDLLRELGYQVVEAGSGEQAVQAWKDRQGAIDLLVTDMILPNGPTGRDLAEVLATFKPGLKVIFTSGYSMEDLKVDNTVVQGVRFLQKPYTRQDLARAVRDSLDA
jgi:CheY-like chemotaxis protein